MEQSAKSHGIEIHKAFEAKQVDLCEGVTAWAVDSTPADCVRVALAVLNDSFDLVLSGVNCGYNVGREITYSGTVGAALEAGTRKTKGIAVSTGFDTFDGARKHLDTAYG